MTAFDPSEAAKTYKELPAEELALIAFVDPDYLPEAKQLAIAELDRRGLAGSNRDLIARAHRELEVRKQLRAAECFSSRIERMHRDCSTGLVAPIVSKM